MAHIVLFVERASVAAIFIVECVTCEWFEDWYDYANPSRHSFGTRALAWEAASLHARTKHKGAARIVLAGRP